MVNIIDFIFVFWLFQEEDLGTYQCVGSNQHGADRRNITVALAVPGQPHCNPIKIRSLIHVAKKPRWSLNSDIWWLSEFWNSSPINVWFESDLAKSDTLFTMILMCIRCYNTHLCINLYFCLDLRRWQFRPPASMGTNHYRRCFCPACLCFASWLGDHKAASR